MAITINQMMVFYLRATFCKTHRHKIILTNVINKIDKICNEFSRCFNKVRQSLTCHPTANESGFVGKLPPPPQGEPGIGKVLTQDTFLEPVTSGHLQATLRLPPACWPTANSQKPGASSAFAIAF